MQSKEWYVGIFEQVPLMKSWIWKSLEIVHEIECHTGLGMVGFGRPLLPRGLS